MTQASATDALHNGMTMPGTAHLYKEKFNPQPYLMQLTKKDYLEVGRRIQWINHDAPIPEYNSFTMDVELISHRDYTSPTSGKMIREAVAKCTVCLYKEGQLIKRAEDYGSETSTDFGDYIEKAVTKAKGRALASAGFGTQFATSDFDAGEKPSPVDGKMGPALADAPMRTASVSPGLPKAAPVTPAPVAPAPVSPAPAAGFDRTEVLTWLQQHVAHPEVAQILAGAVSQTLSMRPQNEQRVSNLSDEALLQAYEASKLVAA